jgi:acyl dehydratase
MKEVTKTDISRLEVGTEFEPLELLVTPEYNEQYLFAEQDYHPRYVERSESGDPIVHPGLLLAVSNFTASPSYYSPPGHHSLHATDEVRFERPAFVNEKLIITFRVSNVYEKRGRSWHDTDIEVRNSKGELILWRRSSGALQTSATPIDERPGIRQV